MSGTIFSSTRGSGSVRYALSGTLLLFTGLAAASVAAGQTPVDRTVATPQTGSVEVSNVTGSIRVVAWDRGEVRVTGELGRGTERLDVTSAGDRVTIEVIIPRNARNVGSTDLEVRVPARKNVTARGVSADVTVQGVTGQVNAMSTSGDVRVSGNPALARVGSTSGDVELEVSTARIEANNTSGDIRVRGTARESIAAESVSGNVQVAAPAPEMMAKSVSGDLTVTGATRRLSASTVSGAIQVRGARLQYGALESVSGNIAYAGALEADAGVSVQSHSGSITLQLPGSVGARFQVTTFSGGISNAFGPEAQRVSRYGPGEELRFTTGDGGALITVKTFSGSVRLVRGG